MPKKLDLKFTGLNNGLDYSGMDIDKETYDFLRELFRKFLPDSNHPYSTTYENLMNNTTPIEGIQYRMRPDYIKFMYELIGLDKEYPSMYNMVIWLTEAAEESGIETLDCDEFVL